MKHTDTIALQGSIDDMRTRIASEQSAMHKVQLGVARWRGALATPDQEERTATDTPSPASQVRWHAEAQCHFLCWLEQGGFARILAEPDLPAVSVTPAGEHQDQRENAKGATAQAKPSTTPISPAHCNDCTA